MFTPRCDVGSGPETGSMPGRFGPIKMAVQQRFGHYDVPKPLSGPPSAYCASPPTLRVPFYNNLGERDVRMVKLRHRIGRDSVTNVQPMAQALAVDHHRIRRGAQSQRVRWRPPHAPPGRIDTPISIS